MVKELQETKDYFEMRINDQETNRFLRVIVEGEKTEGDFFHNNLSLEAAYNLIEALNFDSDYEAKEKLAPIIKLINFSCLNKISISVNLFSSIVTLNILVFNLYP